MSIEVKDIPAKILPLLESSKKYLTFVFAITVMLIYGYLIFQINSLAGKSPDEDAVTERLTTVQRPKIDEEAIEKIQLLEDQNIQVQTLFDQARDNPFTE